MDPSNIKELINALFIECLKFRYWIVLSFIVVSAAVLASVYVLPKSYTSKVVLFADQTNIIGGLLSDQTKVTGIDRAREVRDVIYTNRILTAAAVSAGYENPENEINRLRNAVRVRARGDFVDIEYTSESKDKSFNVISTLTDQFLRESNRKKREESQSAFEFIDAQVSSYKAQLEAAEQRLKEYNSQNIDINRESVSQRVTSLKRDIQNLELEINDSQARLASFEAQLAREPQFLTIDVQAEPSSQERQLEAYEQQLADLRLRYLDTHPDIVSLLTQMDGLRTQIDINRANAGNVRQEQVENPALTSLKDVINEERANLQARTQRLGNLNALLNAELDNAETVAEKQAVYAELTRDYSVTQKVYEDMLKSRESARLSMTLDIQGQGTNYRIHEPPSYPIDWNEWPIINYVVLGPIAGLALPIGLILALVVLDQRVRSVSFMEQNLPPQIKLLTAMPVYDNAITEFASKRSLIILAALVLVYMASYAFVGLFVESTSIMNVVSKLIP